MKPPSNTGLVALHHKQPVELESGELTLHLIATGLQRLFVTPPTPLTCPYPAPLQKGLNRLALACIQLGKTGTEQFESVTDLFDWCHRPLAEWPVVLSKHVLPNEKLLDNGMPTHTCDEWTCTNPDVEAELTERHLLASVLGRCRQLNSPDGYVAFRKLLITTPVMTAFELQRLRLDPTLEPLHDLITQAYEPAPPSSVSKSGFVCCKSCGNLLLLTIDGSFVCEQPRCRRASSRAVPGRVLASNNDVLWLKRGLRRYVAAPGRVELDLHHRLERLNIETTLWPAFDLYDLRIVFPNGESWAVDVKDWANPFLLARGAAPIKQNASHPWSRAFYVFPDDHRQAWPDYVRAFNSRCPHVTVAHPPVKGVFLANFLKQVKEMSRRCADA